MVPPGDLFDQSPGEMSLIRGKLADHVENYVVLSPEGVVLVTSTGTKSSYSRSPRSLKHSVVLQYACAPTIFFVDAAFYEN